MGASMVTRAATSLANGRHDWRPWAAFICLAFAACSVEERLPPLSHDAGTDATDGQSDGKSNEGSVDGDSMDRQAIDSAKPDADGGDVADAVERNFDGPAADADGGSVDGDVCPIGTKRCQDGHPEQCDGATWQSLGDCDVTVPYCYNGTCLPCQPGTFRCTGSSLQECSVTGEWTLKTACAGVAPVCNARTGSCVETRMVGGFSTLGAPTTPTGARVVGGEFLMMPRVCNASMNACFQGGFVP